ncbi:MAG: Mov34/MPN/PAD-1 family protein [Eubacteriales bacterium]
MLIFQNHTFQKMYLCAENAYPRECCGILLGRRYADFKIVCEILAAENTADDEAHFQMDPLTIVKAEASAEEKAFEILGVYHSHPDHDANASNTDVLYMLPGYSYPIVSVKNGACVGTASFVKEHPTDTIVVSEDIFT